MNGGAIDEKTSAYNVAPRSREEDVSGYTWEYEEQDSTKPHCDGSGHVTGLDLLSQASIITILISILLSFDSSDIWTLRNEFPVCDPSAKSRLAPLLPQSIMSESLRRITSSALSCEAMIMELFFLEALFWYSVSSTIGRLEQKEYSTLVGVVTIIGTLCSGVMMRDPASLFLVATPLWACLATVGCFIASRASNGNQHSLNRRVGRARLMAER